MSVARSSRRSVAGTSLTLSNDKSRSSKKRQQPSDGSGSRKSLRRGDVDVMTSAEPSSIRHVDNDAETSHITAVIASSTVESSHAMQHSKDASAAGNSRITPAMASSTQHREDERSHAIQCGNNSTSAESSHATSAIVHSTEYADIVCDVESSYAVAALSSSQHIEDASNEQRAETSHVAPSSVSSTWQIKHNPKRSQLRQDESTSTCCGKGKDTISIHHAHASDTSAAARQHESQHETMNGTRELFTARHAANTATEHVVNVSTSIQSDVKLR